MSSTAPGANDQGELVVPGGYVDMGMWNTNAGSSQTLCAAGPGSWDVRANLTPAGALPVQSYPANKYVFDVPISSLASFSSTYGSTVPSLSQGSWEAAYDIWLTGTPHTEVMIWTTTSSQRLATNGATVINRNVVIGNVSYTYMLYGGFLPQFVRNDGATSGGADVLGILHYLQSIGFVTATAGLHEVQYGFELCNTAGTTLDFATTSFSIK
jgi:hypothetical protein